MTKALQLAIIDKRQFAMEYFKMDKEQEKNLRALKTGPRAKKLVLNGGLKSVNSGAVMNANAQRSAIANILAHNGSLNYAGQEKTINADSKLGDMANLMIANGAKSYSGQTKKFDTAKAFSIVNAAETNSISMVKEAQDRKARA